MEVFNNNFQVKGLTDCGVSCLGKHCVELVEKLRLNILDYKSSIKTADGKGQPIIGKVMTMITCQNKTEDITLYYFWKKLKIILFMINSLETEV